LENNISVHHVFESLRKAGEEVVLFEGGFGAEVWSFVGVVNKKVKVPRGEEAFEFMRKFIKKNKSQNKKSSWEKLDKNASPFKSGFVGFASYDLGAKWQGIKQKVKKDIDCPDAHFVYVDRVFAFSAAKTLSPSACGSPARSTRAIPSPTSNLTYKQYFSKLRTIKKYLFSGDTYQVNFSQRFSAPFKGDAFELYKKITNINPSPFQFFMETPQFAVISNSPERLFKISQNGEIETRPIKGTVPRGKNAAQDRANIKRLLASDKERAELSMIVDLERNDLGKICVPGSVKVTAHRTVEKYSHVIHTSSTVRGKLEKGKDWLDALRALFPGGSITGCPKKRTMEIIDELEDFKRGVYCGSAGYIDLSGRCDFNIMIRTLFLEKGSKPKHRQNCKISRHFDNFSKFLPGEESNLFFHSGGGIVVDSDPKKEYEETTHKANALQRAISESRRVE